MISARSSTTRRSGKKLHVALRRREAEFAIRDRHGDAALRGAFDVALHDEIRLVHFLERARLLADGDGERVHADGAAGEFRGSRASRMRLSISSKPSRVDVEHRERGGRRRRA